MSNKGRETELLNEAEDIISKHADVFNPFEAMRLAMILRHLMAYVDNSEERTDGT